MSNESVNIENCTEDELYVLFWNSKTSIDGLIEYYKNKGIPFNRDKLGQFMKERSYLYSLREIQNKINILKVLIKEYGSLIYKLCTITSIDMNKDMTNAYQDSIEHLSNYIGDLLNIYETGVYTQQEFETVQLLVSSVTDLEQLLNEQQKT